MIFIDESARWHNTSLSAALLERFHAEGVAGASVIRGSAGYGHNGQMHTATILSLATNLPIIVVAVDHPELIDRLHPILDEMVLEGLVTVDEVDGFVPNASANK